ECCQNVQLLYLRYSWIDVISKSKFVPVATPDNPNPEPTTTKAGMYAITDKLNKKLKQCAPKGFRAADRKADTCEKLEEDDKRKLSDLIECIETALVNRILYCFKVLINIIYFAV
ncbi:hypothetical protein Ocin01_20125, partial [Orchesella cincta]